MENLLAKKCIPCSIGDIPLDSNDIANYMKQLKEGWTLAEDGHIEKTYKFKDFKEALAFVNKIGDLAESEGHHPSIRLSWGKVVVRSWTNKIGGLHENDFILAAKIDEIPH